jgi:ABC-type Fe3+/spermidine/putrescine transport system ATPase subunit
MIKLGRLYVKLSHFVLEDISLDIETGDYFMLVGPTGSGKTLLLETIAGLHPLRGGTIWLDDKDITTLQTEKRHIAIVYQDSALFPHLSVAENILFGLRIRHIKGNDIKKRLNDIVDLVGIEHLLTRKTINLSGGERQKVALARCLIIKPRVLLLDEPLSALDTQSRTGLQIELKRIHKESNITIIHVTHDFEETLAMGKHAAVLKLGKIEQVGIPEYIYRKPNSEFVARFTMMRNIFPGRLSEDYIFDTGSLRLITNFVCGEASHACIRPEDVGLSIEPEGNSPNSFRGHISFVDDRGTIIYVTVKIPFEICCILTRNNYINMDLHLGMQVVVYLKPEAIHLF